MNVRLELVSHHLSPCVQRAAIALAGDLQATSFFAIALLYRTCSHSVFQFGAGVSYS